MINASGAMVKRKTYIRDGKLMDVVTGEPTKYSSEVRGNIGKDLYHGSNIRNLSSIAKFGLISSPPTGTPRWENSGEYIYFDDNPQAAAEWGMELAYQSSDFDFTHEPVVLLRIPGGFEKLKGSIVEDPKGACASVGKSYMTKSNIPPSMLEILTRHGWKKLEEFVN